MVGGAATVPDRRNQLLARLRQGPGEEAQQEMAVTPTTPAPSRWTLRTIRATFAWLHHYALSGVWRLLRRYQLKLRSARVQQYSPDPEYAAKVERLEQCLRQVAQAPDRCVVVFMDEMGYTRWPEPAATWADVGQAAQPLAERASTNNQQWRIIGALNAWTGQVQYLDAYIVGRAKVIAFYHQLVQAYPAAERIYVVQDNWSIHHHDDVVAALAMLPQVQPVWLPTYAAWLNPIEKLWRWLRQHVLHLHRLTHDWTALRRRVRTFLDQFAHGSRELLHYVGLLGDGLLAHAMHHS
jgi:transposase